MTRTPLALLLAAVLATPLVLAAPPGPGHYYGQGHADMTWSSTFFPPSMDGTGTGYLTTNLATWGEAIAFGMPLTTMDLHVLPASAPQPVRGVMVMDVPSAADPWWASYPGGIPPGITTGGQVTFRLTGYAEHHPNAVTLYGHFVVVAATGQYAGMTSHGTWSGATTGGGSSFGPYWDFSVIGEYA